MVMYESPVLMSVETMFLEFLTWLQGYKTFFMLSSAELEISNPH